ncbi:MAG: aryl-sulfate sulfotransferase [Bacteroidales bacterium]|nr:aryl-sulfate sulfotransferase [Bacteroidales bacterium]
MNRIIVSLIALLLSVLQGLTSQAQSYGDYTFYCPKTNNKGYLIDLNGNTYHTWTFASNKQTGYSSYLLPGGDVLRTVAKTGNYFTGGPICGEVQKVDYNGNSLWDFVYSTTEYCSHHDIHPMPNGNVLLIAYETKTPAQVTQAGCSQSITMWPDKIVEIQPSGTTGGTVVWEWKAWDHLCQNYNPAKDNYVTSIVQNPGLLNINYNTQKDWMHVNGIDYNEALDQIVISSHYLNEIYVIDHSTTTAEAAGHTGGNSGKGGDFLYRWGNPAAYQASGATIFNIAHNAHWVPADCPNANYLVAFNNKGGAGNKSCVDLINPPYNGYNYSLTPGTAYAPSTYTWRHTYSGSATQNEGYSQQLPNGNMLITISLSGYIYEIDSNQTVVWSKTISGAVTNALRYTACYVNGPVTVTASASPDQGCPGTTVQLSATPSSGTSNTYAWTSIPPGFTSNLQNPVATPSVTTSYIVNVTSGACSATDTVLVTVDDAPPTPVITLTGDSLMSSSISGNQWFKNSTLIQGATGQYLALTGAGTYQVQVTGSNGCLSAMSDPFIWVGISETSFENGIRLFPNPTTGVITLSGESLVNRSFGVTIFNAQGKAVITFKNEFSHDLSSLPGGIYYLTILTDRSEYTSKKVIISN